MLEICVQLMNSFWMSLLTAIENFDWLCVCAFTQIVFIIRFIVICKICLRVVGVQYMCLVVCYDLVQRVIHHFQQIRCY